MSHRQRDRERVSRLYRPEAQDFGSLKRKFVRLYINRYTHAYKQTNKQTCVRRQLRGNLFGLSSVDLWDEQCSVVECNENQEAPNDMQIYKDLS